MKIIKKVMENKFTSNTIWLIADKIFQIVLGLLIGIWTARYLGPSNFGILNYGASFIIFFSVICGLGIENAIIKYFVDFPNKSNIILFSVISIRLFVSTISILIIFLLVSIMHYDQKILIVVITLQSLALIFNSLDTIDYWFQSVLLSKYVVIGKSIARIFVSVWKVYLLISGASLEFFAISSTIEAIVLGVILLTFYFHKNSMNFTLSKVYTKKLLSEGYHFILSGLLVTLFTQMDKIMLGNLIGQESVGIYSVAANLAILWGFIPLAILSSSRPVILKKMNDSIIGYHRLLKQLYAFIFWFGCFVSLFISIFSPIILNILYGQQYLNAAAPLTLLTWASIFSILGTARNIWIVGEGVNKYIKYIFLIGIFVNLILNYFLINLFGVVGSALATLIAQITTSLIAPLFFKETKFSSYLMVQAIFLRDVIPKSAKRMVDL